MPSSLKSLAWSASPPAAEGNAVESYVLFVSGSQELLCAFSVNIYPSSTNGEPLSLHVLPVGMEFAEEGNGEIRTMGIAVVPLSSSSNENVRKLTGIVAGYSDGSIKVRSSSLAFFSSPLLTGSPFLALVSLAARSNLYPSSLHTRSPQVCPGRRCC
jgi:hypothetical protein